MSYKALKDATDKLEQYLNMRDSNTISMAESWAGLWDEIQQHLFEICLNYIIRTSERNPNEADRDTNMPEYIMRAKEMVDHLRSIGRL